MKTFILFFLFLTAVADPCLAQERKILDTIFANDQKNVALFFPAPIRQGITGSDNFVFTYNREVEQYFGLLQAKPGKESNLLVVSTNGSVFSYIVKYNDKLDQLNYFIQNSHIHSKLSMRCQKDKFTLNPTITYLNGAYMSPQLKTIEAALIWSKT